jgi:predicted ArsR family transcriptional regulator
MGRGRPQAVSDERLLLEILLIPDRGTFASELANEMPVGKQTVRDRMRELEEEGAVEIKALDGGNLYRLSDDGLDRMAAELRQHVD